MAVQNLETKHWKAQVNQTFLPGTQSNTSEIEAIGSYEVVGDGYAVIFANKGHSSL